MQREHISIPKLIAYVLFSVIIFALQTGTFGGMRIFGSAVDLLPALVTAAAAFECVLLGLLRYLFSLMHAGASFLIVLRQLAVGTVLTCLFCFIVYLPLRRLSGKSRKRSR